MEPLADLLKEVRRCTLCADQFSHHPRPVVQINPSARILVAGQAPGVKVHASGVPFDDASGDRLRGWMGINLQTFYDEKQIAILPMAFCYPGRGKSGDLAPPKQCALTWRQRLLASLPNIRLTLLVGQYAQFWHLESSGKNLTETVRAWRSYPDTLLPLPHPSPRNNVWLKKNSWFEQEVIPELKQRVFTVLS